MLIYLAVANVSKRQTKKILRLERFCDLVVLDETPKVNQLEDDRFNRMEHFYGSDEIDPGTLEDLDLGDDGKVKNESKEDYCDRVVVLRLVMIQKICFIQIEKNSIPQPILMKPNTRRSFVLINAYGVLVGFRNVPLRQLTAEESAELDKKVSEIERGNRNEDVDEDDAGL